MSSTVIACRSRAGGRGVRVTIPHPQLDGRCTGLLGQSSQMSMFASALDARHRVFAYMPTSGVSQEDAQQPTIHDAAEMKPQTKYPARNAFLDEEQAIRPAPPYSPGEARAWTRSSCKSRQHRDRRGALVSKEARNVYSCRRACRSRVAPKHNANMGRPQLCNNTRRTRPAAQSHNRINTSPHSIHDHARHHETALQSSPAGVQTHRSRYSTALADVCLPSPNRT